MPGKYCENSSHKKHTPITSKSQQGLFGAELARRKAGKSSRMKGITTEELRSHLKESAGKRLPGKVIDNASKSKNPKLRERANTLKRLREKK